MRSAFAPMFTGPHRFPSPRHAAAAALLAFGASLAFTACGDPADGCSQICAHVRECSGADADTECLADCPRLVADQEFDTGDAVIACFAARDCADSRGQANLVRGLAQCQIPGDEELAEGQGP